jgi:hypothetical protein
MLAAPSWSSSSSSANSSFLTLSTLDFLDGVGPPRRPQLPSEPQRWTCDLEIDVSVKSSGGLLFHEIELTTFLARAGACCGGLGGFYGFGCGGAAIERLDSLCSLAFDLAELMLVCGGDCACNLRHDSVVSVANDNTAVEKRQ